MVLFEEISESLGSKLLKRQDPRGYLPCYLVLLGWPTFLAKYLNYWWAVTDSNCRPPGCKPGALPAELTAQALFFNRLCFKTSEQSLLGNARGNFLQISRAMRRAESLR